MVEVFKTNVIDTNHAKWIASLILRQFSCLQASFDLDDCDRILRVEGEDVSPEKICELLEINGYCCQVLE